MRVALYESLTCVVDDIKNIVYGVINRFVSVGRIKQHLYIVLKDKDYYGRKH